MENVFPFYMSIGVNYEDYWVGSPYIAMYARKANYLAIKRKNQELWLQGLYIYNAVSVSIANAFADKRSKREKYMESPIDILPKTEKEIRLEQERERENAIKELTLWAKRWNAKNGN